MTSVLLAALIGVLAGVSDGAVIKIFLAVAVVIVAAIGFVFDYDDGALVESVMIVVAYNLTLLISAVLTLRLAARRRSDVAPVGRDRLSE